MDSLDRLDEAQALLRAARTIGPRALVDRSALMAALAEARARMEEDLREAGQVLLDRDAMIEEARRDGERLRAEALAGATVEEEARRILAESGEFVDRSLAELEAVLLRVLGSIQRTRTRIEEDGGTLTSTAVHRELAED